MGGLQLKRVGNVLWPSFTIIRAIIGVLCIHWGMLMAVGLKLENVSVPPSGLKGGSIWLDCDYLLETDTLQSLKWYRNGHEFFRYSPGTRESSPISNFAQPGVHVDLGESMKVQHNRVRFRLKNLDFNSGGTYRCEISADSPSFRTLHGEGNLSIIALPDSPKPVLSGLPQIVQFGEKISGNCSFADSFPAPEIFLYLNNVKITNSSEMELIHYKTVPIDSRLTTTVGIKFRAAPRHFQFGILQIRCEAKLFDQRWESLWNITHQNHQPPHYSVGQNRYSSGGCCSISLPRISILLLTIALLRTLQMGVSC